MPTTTVIIPNWNGQHLLAPCLLALAAQTNQDREVVLVDNGSQDGSVEWVRSRFPTVRLLAQERNLGFAAAINQGILASNSRYVVTLNNDTEPEPNWLAALVSAAENDPTVGMCASKMLFADRPGIINSTGICLDRAGIAWDRRGGEPDDGREIEPVEVFGPCGGAALYRRAMLDQIGLFDEDFFAYLEDVDLAWRAGKQDGAACSCPLLACSIVIQPPARKALHSRAFSLAATRFGCSLRIIPCNAFGVTCRPLSSMTWRR